MNRKLRCIIVENETIGIKLIEAFVKKIAYLESGGSFEDAFTALDYLQQYDVDILITDIQMPGMNGLDMVRSLPTPPAIIFITAYRDFAPDGFDMNAVDYLIKPVNFERFEKAVTKAKDFLHGRMENTRQYQPPPEFLFLKKESGYLKLLFSEIAYIEANGDYANIYARDNTKDVIRTTMAELEEKLPVAQFIRVHKSYMVNINSIHFVHHTCIELNNKKEIPLSKNYKPEVARRMGIE